MIYVSWAVMYEGATDRAYFEQLIPRVMEDIVVRTGTCEVTIPPAPAVILKRGSVEEVANAACAARDAFHIIFIHADVGGRALEATLGGRSTHYCNAMHAICGWPVARCVTISPRHETEAWILADADAVTGALGYNGSPISLGLPTTAHEAERLIDPKAALVSAVSQVRRKRRNFSPKQIFGAVAQRQSLARLRVAGSFAAFEARLVEALASLGCI